MDAWRVIRTFIVAVLAVAAPLTGCSYFTGGKIDTVRLTSPVVRNDPVYTNGGLRISFRVVDDSRIDLDISNETGKLMRIFWANSTFAAVDDPEAAIGYINGGARSTAGPGKEKVSVISPGENADFEVYPAYSATVDEDGTFHNSPLYVNSDGEGSIESLDGKSIGVNLVMEINGSTRMFRFRLDVSSS